MLVVVPRFRKFPEVMLQSPSSLWRGPEENVNVFCLCMPRREEKGISPLPDFQYWINLFTDLHNGSMYHTKDICLFFEGFQFILGLNQGL